MTLEHVFFFYFIVRRLFTRGRYMYQWYCWFIANHPGCDCYWNHKKV